MPVSQFARSSTPPPWTQLLTLMAFGPDSVLRGTVSYKWLTTGPKWQEPPAALHSDPHLYETGSYLTVAFGKQVRRERVSDASVLSIENGVTTWTVDHDGLATRYDGFHINSPDHLLLRRPNLATWQRGDYTETIAPIEAVDYLGRPAWKVQLKPPARKKAVNVVTVDAEFGFVLEWASQPDVFVRWEALQVDGEPPSDDTFSWGGPEQLPRPGQRFQYP